MLKRIVAGALLAGTAVIGLSGIASASEVPAIVHQDDAQPSEQMITILQDGVILDLKLPLGSQIGRVCLGEKVKCDTVAPKPRPW